MKRFGTAKLLLFIAITLLVLSVSLGAASLFPIQKSDSSSIVLVNKVLINDTFRLSPNETYRQGLGSFHGGENISLFIQNSSDSLQKFSFNFSIVAINGSLYSILIHSGINYNFTAGPYYYDAVFSNSTNTDVIDFQATIQKPDLVALSSLTNETSKILFLISIALSIVLVLKTVFSGSSNLKLRTKSLSTLDGKNRRYLLILLLISLVFWLSIVAFNGNPLGNFEQWYTDHARDSYVSSLFLKDGFSVFNQPLSKLANTDNSYFKFVTWPEMPHLYPLGSILLFAPFGVLLQSGFAPILIYKIEIAIFVIFAHICLYFFLNNYLKKDVDSSLVSAVTPKSSKINQKTIEKYYVWLLKGIGLYIIYVSLVVYAADGMFDSVAFLFSLFAIFMFLTERYDYFFLLIAVSVFFKYQAGIFLFPLIIVAIIKLLSQNRLSNLIRNKAVVVGIVFAVVSIFTAYLSAPFMFSTRPELIMNGINAFSSNRQISWTLQSFSVLLTLAATLVYAFYMLNKNCLLCLLALFLLIPSFMLPYFQNWYLPFIFVYVLIPQQKKEVQATIIWLIFMVFVLSFGGIAFNPLQIFGGIQRLI